MMPPALQHWFDGLAPRERVLVLAGAVVVFIGLIYGLGVQPLVTARAEAAMAIDTRRALLDDLNQVARRHGTLTATASTGPTGDQSLVVLIDRTTRERNLGAYLKRNQPDGPAGVRLRLENVPFDLLVEWLIDTEARYGLTATSASFDPSGEPGRVHSNLVLSQV